MTPAPRAPLPAGLFLCAPRACISGRGLAAGFAGGVLELAAPGPGSRLVELVRLRPEMEDVTAEALHLAVVGGVTAEDAILAPEMPRPAPRAR